MRTLFSIWIWFFYIVNFLVMFPVVAIAWLISRPFDSFRRFPNYFMFLFGVLMIRINPRWKVSVTGTVPRPLTGPVIVVSNHQSFLDMPLEAYLGWRVRWIAKRSMFRIPFMGWVMSLSGHLSVDRDKKMSFRSLGQQMEFMIRHKIPVHVFAEGTRSRDGIMRPFKNGVFITAKKQDCKILPIILDGTREILPSGDWRFRIKGDLKISVLDPVCPGEFSDIKALRDHVWTIMHDELQRLRRKEDNRAGAA